MEIKRNGSQPSGKGPAEWFTRTVRIDPLFGANDARRAAAELRHVEPGARTAGHTHPLGQTLVVISGLGWVQARASPSRKSGQVMWSGFEPREKHWHGASLDDSHDAHRHPGASRRQGRRLDGARDRQSTTGLREASRNERSRTVPIETDPAIGAERRRLPQF